MSTALIIGSEPTDLKNIKNTINILTDCLQNNTTTQLSYNNLENLLDWYKGIYGLLSDFSVFVNQVDT